MEIINPITTLVTDWKQFPNFTKDEFDCSATKKNKMTLHFMNQLQAMRTRLGFPFIIISGYRDANHPEEKKKVQPGYHYHGIACDIACYSTEAYYIISVAAEYGFTGIGVYQKQGAPRHIHLDMRPTNPIVYSK